MTLSSDLVGFGQENTYWRLEIQLRHRILKKVRQEKLQEAIQNRVLARPAVLNGLRVLFPHATTRRGILH